MLSARFAWPLALLAGAECALLFAALCLSEAATGYVTGHPWDPAHHAGAFALVCVLVNAMMFSVGLYTWHAASSYADLALRIVAAFTTAYLVYAALVYAVDELAIAPGTLGAAIVLAIPTLFGVRVAFIRLSNQAHLKSRVLVLGTGEQAARIGDLERRGRAARFVAVSFVDLNDSEAKVPADRVCRMPHDLLGFTDTHGIDEIVIAMEDRRGRLPADELIKARLNGLRVTDYQRFSEFVQGRVDLGALRPSWFLYSDGFRSGRVHRFLKRAFDLMVSLALLVFSFPLLVLTAIAIKLESAGPIFYRQERVGLGGRPFSLLKFRSMAADAEKSGQAQWAAANDPRVTRVGAVIRKTRIDEIPQAINVLRGDMSFVGPRPERPRFVDMLATEIPYYHERHSVKPGITGWAQLNYPYGASVEDARQKLQYDLFYIKYFSILFDLLIVMQTIRVVLWRDGAR